MADYLDDLRSLAGMIPRKILHIGANKGHEVPDYARSGIDGYHVEAIPATFAILEKVCSRFAGQTAILACLDAVPGRLVEFKVASNGGEASSILDLGRHAAAYPDIVVTETIRMTTQTIDALRDAGTVPGDIDFAVIDIQGAEDRALQGADGLLRSDALWGLLIEVAIEPLYDGGADFLTLYQTHLLPHGFYLSSVRFSRAGWSDALFLKRYWPRSADETTPLAQHRERRRPDLSHGRNIAADGICTQSSLSDWSHPDDAARAAKGELTGRFSFHTGRDDNPWWQVDFGSPRRFDEIHCFNRSDMCQSRARTLIVEISDDGDRWDVLHRNLQTFGGYLGGPPPLHVDCPDTVSRYVRLRLPTVQYLHLDGIRIIDTGSAA